MLPYALSIFLGAFLLFQVQPLIARAILPWFGGTAAVWTTCMLFFQVLLLAGYAYAHGLIRLRPRAQVLVHSALLLISLGVLGLQARAGGPLLPPPSLQPDSPQAPVFHIIALLGLTIGLPYFVLSATSPLLQAWFARRSPGVSPYRLYTLSNAGSLLALLTYPVLVEPHLALPGQAGAWSAAYAFSAVVLLGLTWSRQRHPETAGQAAAENLISAPAPRWSHRLSWLILPAIASVLLLAVTNQLCQELAVIPFLWILPLSLYLLSFIICFDNPRWYDRRVYVPLMLLILPVVAWIMTRPLDTPMRWQIAIYCGALFICCMVCHGETVARKPHPRWLTGFYLAISTGGALGGLFVGVVAPIIFTRFIELHLALAACWILAGVALWVWPDVTAQTRRALVAGLVIITVFLPAAHSVANRDQPSSPVLLASRNFYGIFRVEEHNRNNPRDRMHVLIHGATIHGLQYISSQMRHRPVSYYAPTSGLGLALSHHPRRATGTLRVGVLGLGTGNIAIYGQPGDLFRFYEINPEIEQVGRDPRYFTYLRDSQAEVRIELGDARLSLERELRQQGPQQFDVLVMDAFSSDSVPAHLLTKEAFVTYLAHLRQPDGVIAVNISNRFLDLRPVIEAAAGHFGLKTMLIVNRPDRGVYAAHWMLMTNSQKLLSNPVLTEAAREEAPARRVRLWTDDYTPLAGVLRRGH